jgi:hypothetical protein
MLKLKQLGLKLWHRYVDDIFASTGNLAETEKILSYLNNQHPNIKFTLEVERDNKLPFLDVLVKRRHNKYVTTSYHKKTFTGVYLNWNSLTARRYKIGLIKCLLHRIWMICTEKEDRDLEIKQLKHTLEENKYPSHIIEKEFNNFEKRRLKKELERATSENRTEDRETSNELKRDMKRFIVLPYVNKLLRLQFELYRHDEENLIRKDK